VSRKLPPRLNPRIWHSRVSALPQPHFPSRASAAARLQS